MAGRWSNIYRVCGWLRQLVVLVMIAQGGGAARTVNDVRDQVDPSVNPRIVEHPENQFAVRDEPTTLNCKAEGNPTPVIEWYHDGKLVRISGTSSSSHRMLLPSGQLFFLRVIDVPTAASSGLLDTDGVDVGQYYCKATNPSTGASVVSWTARLDVAAIDSNFVEHPIDVSTVIGGLAEFRCKPPKAKPAAHVRWIKDYQDSVLVGNRITLIEETILRIVDVHKEDAGFYTCVASNVAGQRKSRAAKLIIGEKPKIFDDQVEVTAAEGTNVLLKCRTSGDPTPTIVWKKIDDHMPAGRSQITDEQGLEIQHVTSGDEGLYGCTAENALGSDNSLIRLAVHTPPSLTVKPFNRTVGIGTRVVLRCEATGNPLPAVFWNKETNNKLMFPNQDNGRISVSDDGTLEISSVQMEDTGEYVCRAISSSGAAYAKVFIDVKDVDPRSPPVIQLGPHNDTLPVGGRTILPCTAAGDPAPTIHWFHNRTAITGNDWRYTLLDNGALQVTELRLTESGVYTCKAFSELGETVWSATLTVLPRDVINGVISRRRVEASSLPRAPTRPTVTVLTGTSVTLTWKSAATSSSPSSDVYVIEYFSHDIPERGWIIASDNVTGESFTVDDLRPDTTYIFLVRARNSVGISLPSRASSPVRTKGVTDADSLSPADVAALSERLSGQVISLLQPLVVSPTAIRLTWQVHRSHRYIEGVRVKYRTQADNNVGSQYRRSRRLDVTMTSLVPGGAAVTSFTLMSLQKYTWYEMCVQPYYKSVDGHESNWVRARTQEDVPSAAPRNIVASMVDNETLYLSWEQPPISSCNGPLIGYTIYLYSNESGFSRQLLVNLTSDAVYIHDLEDSVVYNVRIAARNSAGEGIRSDVIAVGQQDRTRFATGNIGAYNMATYEGDVVSEPWFIVTLIAVLGCTMWIAMCLFCVWLYRKNKQHSKLAGTVRIRNEEQGSDKLSYLLQSLNLPNYLQVDATANIGVDRSSIVRRPDMNSSCVTVPVATVSYFDEPTPSTSTQCARSNSVGETGQPVFTGRIIRLDLTSEGSAFQLVRAPANTSSNVTVDVTDATCHSTDNATDCPVSGQSAPPTLFFPPPPDSPPSDVAVNRRRRRARERRAASMAVSHRRISLEQPLYENLTCGNRKPHQQLQHQQLAAAARRRRRLRAKRTMTSVLTNVHLDGGLDG